MRKSAIIPAFLITLGILLCSIGIGRCACVPSWARTAWGDSECREQSTMETWAGLRNGLPGGLVAHYFGGTPVSGTTVFDEVQGRDHTAARGVQEGGAWNFNGNGDYIQVPASSSISIYGLTSFTVSIWVHALDDGGGNAGRMVYKTDNPANTTGSGFDLLGYQDNGIPWGTAGASMKVWFIVKTTGTNAERLTADTALPLANDPPWHQVVGVYNRNGDRKCEIFIDGVLNTSTGTDTAGGGAISDDSAIDLFIGNRSDGLRYWSHKLFDTRMWNRALSPAEIANLYLNKPVATDSLMAWWPGDEGAGTSVYDITGNANTGTCHNVGSAIPTTQVYYSRANTVGFAEKDSAPGVRYPRLSSGCGFAVTDWDRAFYGPVAYDATLSDATLSGFTYWPDGSSVTLTLPRAPSVIQIDVTNGPKFFTAWPNYVQVAAEYADITNTSGHIFTSINSQGKKNILLYQDDLSTRQRDAVYQCTRTATSVVSAPVPSHILLNLPFETDLIDTVSSIAADLTRNNEAAYTADADSLVYTVAANTGRISSAGGTVTGLVLEAQEENLVPQSDSLLTGGTDYFVTASYGEADTPFPGKTSGTITDNGVPNVHIKMCFGTIATPGARYSVSCFVKDIDRGYASVGVVFFLGGAPVSVPFVSFNLSTQAMVLGDASSVQNPDQATYDAIGTGWYRVRLWGSTPPGVDGAASFVGTSSVGGIAYAGAGESIRYFGLDYKVSPFQTNYISAGVPTTSAQEVASIAASAAVQTAISAGDGTAMATFISASNAIDLTPAYFINLINNNELNSAGMLGIRYSGTTATIEASGGSATATVAVAAGPGSVGGDIEYNEIVMAAVQWESSATRMRTGYRKIADASWTWGAWATTVGTIFPVNSGALLYFGGGEAGISDISLRGIQDVIMRDDVLSDAEMDSAYTF